ncbi:MAG: AAA family ATPase [Desulfobacterales bacterium]|nr:AAA family ATPase [Desulfobacterales bacterium]
MKISNIQLTAYGPFTGNIIDLGGSGADFHMVFGPNEAGKSSALRALRDMLFGIPTRTPDNFLHSYAHLRLGAALVKSDGSEIEFLRRKGQVKTLRGPDDETVLEEDALVPFLGGISRDVFEQMFAIGHADLVLGGEEIISGEGDVGKALFAAGAGLIRLQEVQQKLADQLGDLFKPGGSTPQINKSISTLKSVRKEQREVQLLAKTWREHDRALRQAKDRMETVRETLKQNKQRVAKLQRIREALPLIVRRKEIETELAGYAGVPDLPEDFSEKRREAESDLKVAKRDLDRVREVVARIDGEIAALQVSEAMLRKSALVEALQHQLGSYNKAQADRPDRVARKSTLQKQAARKLKEIDLNSDGEIKLSPVVVGEIKNLGAAYERLNAKLEANHEQRKKVERRLGQLEKDLKEIAVSADVADLEAAVQAAQEAGPVEKQQTELRRSVESLEGDLNRALRRQVVWKGSLEAVDTLACPSRESIDKAGEKFSASQRRLEKLEEKQKMTENEIAQARTELQAIALTHDVPTEADLKDARMIRSEGWGIIRRSIEGNKPDAAETGAFVERFEGVPGLADAFEDSMVQADGIADRLWREADQVSQKGLLEAQIKQHEATLEAAKKEIDSALVKRKTVEDAWQALWEPSGTTPLSPGEMRPWLADIESIRERLGHLRGDKARLEQGFAQLQALKSNVRLALDVAGLPQKDEDQVLVRLIQIARTYCKEQRDLAAGRAVAQKELSDRKQELAQVESAIADLEEEKAAWKIDWERNVKEIGLDADRSPSAAEAVIDSIREVRKQIDEADILKKRIDGIDRDAAVFEKEVAELVDSLAPDLEEEPPGKAAEMLKARLKAAEKAESRKQGLGEQKAAAVKDHDDADKRIFQGTALIESMCREASCETAGDLADMESKSRIRKDLTRQRSELEERLRGLSAGAAVDEFVTEAALISADTIDPELEELENEMKNLEEERSNLDQNIGIEKTRLEEMDGSARAADLAEDAERLLGGLETDVETYARLKIASAILAGTVEQYREKHQGPLISRASELFSQMTLGAFSRLRAEYDSKGNPVLVGIRPDNGSQIGVEGMSDGTADQLYLALRLASLEQYLGQNEPLPFIVDDILLRFDDERALATLEVLAELSKMTQVLFFTHHQHMVDLANSNIDSEVLMQHVLV